MRLRRRQEAEEAADAKKAEAAQAETKMLGKILDCVRNMDLACLTDMINEANAAGLSLDVLQIHDLLGRMEAESAADVKRARIA